MQARHAWWQTSTLPLAVTVLAALPLIWPAIPPLVDLPGHMGRYHVQLEIGSSASLQQYFSFTWRPIGNLGVDLLVVPLSKIFDLELAVKLIAIASPVLTVAGLLAISRASHGKLQPSALFALPLAYSHPFQFGFLNFSLSMAFALLSFALWLRLSAAGSHRLRTLLFLPIGILVWFTHAFGWGFLGLLCAASIVAGETAAGRSFLASVATAFRACVPLLPPVALMMLWRSDTPAGLTGDWFNISAKLFWALAILREESRMFDIASALTLILLPYVAWRVWKLPMDRTLTTAGLFCMASFLVMPRILFGSAYADMRLAPYVVALFVLAIDSSAISNQKAQLFAAFGVAFFMLRLVVTTANFAHYDRVFEANLAALSAIPRGSSVVALVAAPCRNDWELPRLSHLPSMAIVRRDAFANDQWLVAGANLIGVHAPLTGQFTADPSQIVYPVRCAPYGRTLDSVRDAIPDNGFNRLWLVGFPDATPREAEKALLRSGDSMIYRIGAGSQ